MRTNSQTDELALGTYKLHGVELIHQAHVTSKHLVQRRLKLLQLVQSLRLCLFVLIIVQIISAEDSNGFGMSLESV